MTRLLILASGLLVAWWLHQRNRDEPQQDEQSRTSATPEAAEPPKDERSRPSATAGAAEPPKKVREEPAPRPGRSGQDDLKVVEGVGPKIETLLQEAGIRTLSDLADASPSKLRSVLDEAGTRYRLHDPSTWPRQARIAAEGKWDDLKAYQAELKAGR